MALVFQYGSNTLESEINSVRRLNGRARFISIAETVENYVLVFDVFSRSADRNCATSNIVPTAERKKVWGVLYEVPDELIRRQSAPQGSVSLDAIEGENKNHRRQVIRVRKPNGEEVSALTYVTLRPRKRVQRKTSLKYAQLIIQGLQERRVPQPYIDQVKTIIATHSPRLAKAISTI